jgi:hypothetical protein
MSCFDSTLLNTVTSELEFPLKIPHLPSLLDRNFILVQDHGTSATLISNNAAAAHVFTAVSYASPSLTPSQFRQSTNKNGTSDYVDMF